jgi:hypothetical protein
MLLLLLLLPALWGPLVLELLQNDTTPVGSKLLSITIHHPSIEEEPNPYTLCIIKT